MCCRLDHQDYFDSDEEQIQIDHSNEPGNTRSKAPANKVNPPSETIPFYLLLDRGGLNLENRKNDRKIRRRIGMKNIPTKLQSVKSPGLGEESSDMRQLQSWSCHSKH